MSWGRIITRAERRQLERENAKLPATLQQVPRSAWPGDFDRPGAPVQVWRSRDFLVQVFEEKAPALVRLSINRTTVRAGGDRWDDSISWDELQRLKGECGYGAAWAVEIFPASDQVVNVANMRHLWVLATPPAYGWHGGRRG